MSFMLIFSAFVFLNLIFLFDLGIRSIRLSKESLRREFTCKEVLSWVI